MKRRDLLMADQLRGMSVGELRTTLDQKHLELMNLRFQLVTGQLTDTSRLKKMRRQIALFETILRERELGLQREGEK